MVGEGLEPPKLKTPDLQSGPVAALVTHQRNLRDSNPRRILTLGALVKRCLKPLGQDSKLPRYDSNVHVFRRLINSQVRLPFRHEALVPGLRLERRNADPKSAVIPFHHPGEPLIRIERITYALQKRCSAN